MTLRKTAAQRRANLPRKTDYTRQFAKTWDRLNKAGKYDMARLKEAMAILTANDGPLGAEWNDHALLGKDWKDSRELHVGGDFLLVYKITADDTVIFVDAGTHSELFG